MYVSVQLVFQSAVIKPFEPVLFSCVGHYIASNIKYVIFSLELH